MNSQACLKSVFHILYRKFDSNNLTLRILERRAAFDGQPQEGNRILHGHGQDVGRCHYDMMLILIIADCRISRELPKNRTVIEFACARGTPVAARPPLGRWRLLPASGHFLWPRLDWKDSFRFPQSSQTVRSVSPRAPSHLRKQMAPGRFHGFVLQPNTVKMSSRLRSKKRRKLTARSRDI